MTWPTDRWPTSSEIADRLRELANNSRYSAICTVTDFAEPTNGGNRGNYVRIGTAGGTRPSVVILGGVHAREWAPPTALTNLILALCEAHVADTPVTMGSTSRSAEDVHAIINGIALYIAPMVNSDGYDYSLTNDAGGPLAGRDQRGWRKNRSPAPSSLPGGCTAANAVGTDINRNFDVLWKFTSFYVVGSNVSASTNPCEETYIGSKEFSEPESRNVRALLDAVDPQFFVDVHMSGGTVLYSWGVEENGPIAGPTPTLNQGKVRDGTVPSTNPAFNGYKEPINQDFLTQISALAGLMADATGAATAGKRYNPQPSALLYPAPGASDDYAFSRNLSTAKPPIQAFTIESGVSFLPLFDTEFPPVQNEIQAAILALARYAVLPPSNKSCRC
jgi:murein tripeptide amidase MpaA